MLNMALGRLFRLDADVMAKMVHLTAHSEGVDPEESVS